MSASQLNTRLLRVGEVARQVGKTTRALRFYEELDLLAPTQRTPGGFRLYHPDTLIRIRWIERLQELGFSLHDIRIFLDAFRGEPHGPAAMDQLRNFYAEKLNETREAIARLQSLEADLERSLTYLEGCQTCSPGTPRSACHTCDEEHENDAPPMVLAVASPI